MTTSTRAPRFSIHTLGCKVNQYDSERIRTQLMQRGFQLQGEADESLDLIVVNTCSVTSESDRKGRQMIRKLIRQNPDARVAVTGCYSERKPLEIGAIEGVDEIVPIQDQDAWAARIADELGWGCEDQSHLWKGGGIEIFHEHTRAFIKIQDGCDLKCTFCSIPTSRGVARSRPIPEVMNEARRMIDLGYPEVVLCGICIGHYGIGEDFGLHNLLEELANIKGVKRIRISSLEPQDVSDDLFRVMADYGDIACPHLHLPIQSGSNKILRRMKRPYQRESFFERIQTARDLIPNFEVSTDIMVGFPDESDDDFEQTLESVRISRFNRVHSFPFSVRDEAPAARMKNHLPPNLIKQRRIELDRIANETANKVKQAYLTKSLPVLCESSEQSRFIGYTSNYLRAEFTSPLPIQKGEEILVQFDQLRNGRLHGKPLSK
ncbi:MAG: tRNA (N(6)-L-threonylcarbamoyladenosine(37)-C(2))-methylthiotransferase MtaB [Candidatus Hinthialibacter antarcticus]|nr:tRNA (N(6)-L-threonylcarbamoyladenosine(37)-C(2))-methylthiotransferase MtaB [Candidatus Hinthialibacter antarcticus]